MDNEQSTLNGPPLAGFALRLPRHRAHPRARHMWRTRAALSWLFLVVPLAGAVWLFENFRGWTVYALIVASVCAVAHVVVMPEWRYRVHRWETDDIAVYTRAGWLTQTSRIAPITRIQTVDSKYGVIHRLFGLGSFTVTTASASGSLEIDGLERQVVEELVSRLTLVTSQDPGDAT
ncbi:PH domain-containing protein [Austwickia chelonae]|uniref:PH domain-containing protein n=1 Tax=Austwickia chelonae TaxID=100225 RepID=UPI001967F25D|nr:PH domain-containing protein [Austwickia chelonae]